MDIELIRQLIRDGGLTAVASLSVYLMYRTGAAREARLEQLLDLVVKEISCNTAALTSLNEFIRGRNMPDSS